MSPLSLIRGSNKLPQSPRNPARAATLIALAAFGAVALYGCGKAPKPAKAAADPPASDPPVVASVTYDGPTGVMVVTFSSGVVYDYYDVPYGVYVELMNAPSLSLFFTDHIRGRYRYRPMFWVPWHPLPYYRVYPVRPWYYREYREDPREGVYPEQPRRPEGYGEEPPRAPEPERAEPRGPGRGRGGRGR